MAQFMSWAFSPCYRVQRLKRLLQIELSARLKPCPDTKHQLETACGFDDGTPHKQLARRQQGFESVRQSVFTTEARETRDSLFL